MERRQELIDIIKASKWRMGVLRIVSDLDLPDWWIGAGFVRNAVWDHFHGRPMTPLNDIDVIYFDAERPDPRIDEEILMELQSRGPKKPWSVHNQALMHERNGHAPYSSSIDALKHWSETATAVAVCLDRQGRLSVAAPHGLDDLLDLVVRPTTPEQAELVRERAAEKRWLKIWPELKLEL